MTDRSDARKLSVEYDISYAHALRLRRHAATQASAGGISLRDAMNRTFSALSGCACECGRHRNDSHDRKPCPDCGSKVRHMWRTVTESITLTDELNVAATYAPDRSWREAWGRVTARLDDIRAIYAGTFKPDGFQQWKDAVHSFCSEVHHLAEWLDHDPAESSVAAAEAQNYRNDAVHLRIAADLWNSHKHYARKAGKASARISHTASEPAGRFVVISHTASGSGECRDWDALRLAEGCVAEWRAFFDRKGLRV